ncbi:hypothetical protein LQZ19_01930 [Treponema primitia]|uniref:hypothetical protein n=1 Tax=Treponema primitia TaxID=88058 RepID=UPI00397F843A
MVLYNKKGNSLDVNIRLARPEEAPQLIALLLKQHGLNYPNRKFYDEIFLRQALASGILRFAVAVLASDGTLAAMVGSDEENEFPGCLIFNLLTVKIEFRGFSLGKKIHHYLLQEVLTGKYTCIYAHCLTLDTISQSNHAEFGYTMSGLLINRYIYDVNAENLKGLSLPLKRTHLMACYPLLKRDVLTLYPPTSHARYIAELYKDLNVTYSLGEPGEPAVQRSKVDISQNEMHRYGELFVQEAGNDFEDVLSGYLDQYAHLEGQTFNAFVNLNDPGASYACSALERKGFFFTGIHPLSGSGEYMILHYSPGLVVDFNKIMVIPEFTKRLRYIQNLYKEVHVVKKD